LCSFAVAASSFGVSELAGLEHVSQKWGTGFVRHAYKQKDRAFLVIKFKPEMLCLDIFEHNYISEEVEF